jgi:chromosomal replication initiation ATPase DnaA
MKAQLQAVEHTADRMFAEQLAGAVAPAHGRVPLAVFADNRDAGSVAARREVARMLRALGWSLPRIGRAMGRHHTAVLHMLRDPSVRRERPKTGPRLPVARAA